MRGPPWQRLQTSVLTTRERVRLPRHGPHSPVDPLPDRPADPALPPPGRRVFFGPVTSSLDEPTGPPAGDPVPSPLGSGPVGLPRGKKERDTCTGSPAPSAWKKAKAFAVGAAFAKETLNVPKDNRDGFITARGTKSQPGQGVAAEGAETTTRPAIWKPDHDIVVNGRRHLRPHFQHQRPAHRVSQPRPRATLDVVLLCDAPEQLTLIGPWCRGAHRRPDAEVVAARDAKESFEAFTKARKEATAREVDAYCKQLKAAFAALGFKVYASGGLMSDHATRISLAPDDAAKILDALGATTARRPVDPMPVWSVRYGVEPDEDKDPLLLGRSQRGRRPRLHDGGNTATSVVTTARTCRSCPRKLHITRFEDPPEPPKEADAA